MCIFTLHKKDCQQVPTGTDEVIRAHCYCDRARMAVTDHSNGRADGIGPLLLIGGHKMHIFTANIPTFHARYRR
jgi:hypothetical protein